MHANYRKESKGKMFIVRESFPDIYNSKELWMENETILSPLSWTYSTKSNSKLEKTDLKRKIENKFGGIAL